jgi:pimeloyl-ACP methyl ester carboxylesterase
VTYSIWQKLVPLLSPHYQLILVELPGMDAASNIPSDKPYYEVAAERLEAFRVALGIERWAILAYSTGTRVGQAYMQRYPQRVTRAVFLCPLYLRRFWLPTFQAGEWVNAHHARVASWFVTGWRLYGWLMLIGFNLRDRSQARAWMHEIERRPIEPLKRMLLEVPGKGRAPFTLPDSPSVPSLFVWAQRDLLATHPAHPRPNDAFLFASHGGAPVLMPETIAALVLPFLKGSHTSSQDLTQGGQPKRGRFKLLSQASQRKAAREMVIPSRC